MPCTSRAGGLLSVLAVCAALAWTSARSAPDPEWVRDIALPATTGRIDHLSLDPEHQLLFVAALGNDAVDVVDLQAGRRVARLAGRREPQGVLYLTAQQLLLVANGHGGTLEAFRGTRREAVVPDLPDADNLRLDPLTGLVYAGYGHALAEIDPRSMKVLRRLDLPGHPESLQLDAPAGRIYVNVPAVAAVLVLDRASGRTIGTWSLAPRAANFPMALDQRHHRLVVATRQPPALLVLDADTGALLAETAFCGDADDLFVDAQRQVLYGMCGDGQLAIVPRPDPDRLGPVRRIRTADGARTGLFVPALDTLVVAAPARAGQEARLLLYRVH